VNANHLFYAALGLAGAGAMGAGLVAAGGPGLAFGFFAYLILGGAAVCIWEQSIVRSAFSLMGTFLGVAGLFVLLGSDFLAMAQILIYVGGILALLLFGVMLSPPDNKERSLARVGGTALMIGAGVAFIVAQISGGVAGWLIADQLPQPNSQARAIGLAFLDPKQYVVAFELAAYLLTVALVAAVYIARRRRVDFEPPPEPEAQGEQP
jgi:NADH:ubiquinone oxidoreductase subunit 6 (subunit J)